MNQRILCFSVDDLAVDPDGVAAAITQACARRRAGRRVQAVCQTGADVYVVLFPLPSGERPATYLLEAAADVSSQGFVSLLNERYAAGLDVAGTVKVYDSVMVLFARKAPAPG